MAFAQLTYREGLSDIEACFGAIPYRLYHMGIRSSVSRSTLADANEEQDWRIYADLAQFLIAEARRLCASEPLGLELDKTAYALDATTIELRLGLFPWAHCQEKGGAIKRHTCLDLRGSIPAYMWLTDGEVHDVRILNMFIPEPGSIHVLDRGYAIFERPYRLHQAQQSS